MQTTCLYTLCTHCKPHTCGLGYFFLWNLRGLKVQATGFFCYFQGVSIQKLHKLHVVPIICISQTHKITPNKFCLWTHPSMVLSAHRCLRMPWSITCIIAYFSFRQDYRAIWSIRRYASQTRTETSK